jgi:hypothetical protein
MTGSLNFLKPLVDDQNWFGKVSKVSFDFLELSVFICPTHTCLFFL